MIFMISVLCGLFILCSSQEITNKPRNILLYPVCINDEDCYIISNTREEQYLCFQYMCYPWRQSDTGFRQCRRSSECRNLTVEEGGSGEDGQCFRHPDRRNVHIGICMDKWETVQCFDDTDCQDNLRCVVGYCGDQDYLDALVAMPCEEDYLCEDLHLGPECCLDVGGGVAQIMSGNIEAEWGKRCCDNIRAPVTIPAANISLTDSIISKLDQKIFEIYTPWGMDIAVCTGLPYNIIQRLDSCSEFLTTTTSTTTTKRTTKKSKVSVINSVTLPNSRYGVSSEGTSFHSVLLTIVYLVMYLLTFHI